MAQANCPEKIFEARAPAESSVDEVDDGTPDEALDVVTIAFPLGEVEVAPSSNGLRSIAFNTVHFRLE